MPELMKLGAHPRFTFGGQRGAGGAGGPAHGDFLWLSS